MTKTLIERDGTEGAPPAFLALPAQIYADDLNWIPEEPESVASALSVKNPYFAGREARIFCIPERVRAVAFFDPELRIRGEKVAYFGYFESTGDGEANRLVMDRVEMWAKERGALALYGPIQFTTHGNYRVRLHLEPGGLPFIGEPQNPASYPAQLEALGLRVHRSYLTQIISLEQVLERLRFMTPLRDHVRSQGYRFEPVTPESWLPRMPQLHEMVDTTFNKSFAYSKPSYEAFVAALGEGMLRKVCPVASVVVISPQGEPAAFALGYPHYGPLLVQARGADRVAVRDLDYQRHRPLLGAYPPRGIIAKTIGVHPAHRGKHLVEAMLIESFDRISAEGPYDWWYAAMIRDGNFSRSFFAAANSGERRYALYAKRLDGGEVGGDAPAQG